MHVIIPIVIMIKINATFLITRIMVFPECLGVLADILNCIIMLHYFRCFILKDEIWKKSIHSINPTPGLITTDFLFCWYIWFSNHLCLYSRKLITTWRESECLTKKKENKTPEKKSNLHSTFKPGKILWYQI